MDRALTPRSTLAAALLALASCSSSHVRDGGDPLSGDAGPCPAFGVTQTCGPDCPGACVWEGSEDECRPPFGVCFPYATDPADVCSVELRWGARYCYSGRLCAVDESIADVDGEAWRSGVCVAEGYCRWLQSGARAPYVACRYSEGHRFEEGPLEVACEEGATPESPFCGGACGDCPTEDRTGAPSIDFEPSCVGRSEARSFGVCAPYAVRCSPGPSAVSSIFECENRLRALGPVGTGVEFHCACMVLSPALIPELADHGWPVALESCLAYRDRFPDQVLCVDEAWNEL